MSENEVKVSPKGLIKKLAEVMAETGYVKKSGTNQKQGYKYVTEADVLDQVREGLAKRGVVCLPNVHSINRSVLYKSSTGNDVHVTDVVVTWTFIDGETGETHQCSMPGCGTDTGDKGIYKAITGSSKYMFLKGFMLPTGDDPENEKPDYKEGKAAAEAVAKAKIEAHTKANGTVPVLTFTPATAGMTYLSGVEAMALLKVNISEEDKNLVVWLPVSKKNAIPSDQVEKFFGLCQLHGIEPKIVPAATGTASAPSEAVPTIRSCERGETKKHQVYLKVRYGTDDVSSMLNCFKADLFPYLEAGVGKTASLIVEKVKDYQNITGIEKIGSISFSLNQDDKYVPDIQTKVSDSDLPEGMFA